MALVVLIQTWLIILVAVVGSIFLIALFILLYVFVFSRNAAKRTVKDLEKKYSYLDALLIGQDSQYIHRLEIVSRTNLLYVDIYNEFSRRFKSIYEIDDKFAESKIKQVKTLIANKQYKNIKLVIENVKNAVQILEDKVNELDRDLYDVIKPEEEARQAILRLKESYRAVKQLFFSLSSDLELILPSFIKSFWEVFLCVVNYKQIKLCIILYYRLDSHELSLKKITPSKIFLF